jgi:hypothetical protein
MDIEHISMITTKIFLSKNDVTVSQGTGFYFTVANNLTPGAIHYLVTNYHVLTGSSPNDNKMPIGDNIIFNFHFDEVNTGHLKTIKFPLFTKKGDPVWISSKNFPDADIAIIPIIKDLYSDCKVFSISEDWTKSPIKIRPTSLVTLIGYPYNLSDEINALPIWKSGSIASEPDKDFNGKPLLMIDISAFPGMSGSPVFAIANGAFESENRTIMAGNQRKFIGIYASMQFLQQKRYIEEIQNNTNKGMILSESLQLGYVWKERLIIDIINSINIQQYFDEIFKNLF